MPLRKTPHRPADARTQAGKTQLRATTPTSHSAITRAAAGKTQLRTTGVPKAKTVPWEADPIPTKPKPTPAKRTSGRTTKATRTTKKATPARRSSTSARSTKPNVVKPGPGQSIWVLEVPYECRTEASYAGARWRAEVGWVYIGAQLPATLQRWQPKAYSWTAWLHHDLSKGPVGTATATAETGSIIPRPDQVQDANTIIAARKAGAPEFLLASDVGTGKTIVAWLSMLRMPGIRNILIVCPLSVVPHWRRTIRMMGDGGRRVCVINYDSIKKLLQVPESAKDAKKTATKNRRHAKEGISKVAWDVVISDESHYLSNPVAQRSSTMERIIRGPGAAPAWIIRMSATAGSNPAQLAYLHRGLAWRTGTKPRASITMEQYVQWCEQFGFAVSVDRFDHLKWAKNDEDLERARQLLFDATPTWGIRRKPQGWPEQQRVPLPVELSPQQQVQYEQTWEEFQRTLKGLETKPAKTGKEQATRRMAGQAAQTRYRQKAGLIRVPHTAGFIAELVTKGYQVAVSCEYIASVDALTEVLTKAHLAPAIFTGRNRNEREQQRLAYQRGEYPVIIFTPCEGFSLHAGEAAVNGNDVPRALVVAEPRWSPKQSLQIEGRGQRDGEEALAYYAYAEDTIEERVISVVIEGVRATKMMMGDDTASLAPLAEALGLKLILDSNQPPT